MLIANSLKDLEKVVNMSNEDNVVTILRRIEDKLDKLLKQEKKPKQPKQPKPEKVRSKNGKGEVEAAILQVLVDGKPRHNLQLSQEINDAKLTTVPAVEVSVGNAACKMAKAGEIVRIRRGVYCNLPNEGE